MARSSDFRGATLAALLGGISGFLALFLREFGLVLAVVVLAPLGVYYVRGGRTQDVGWMLVGAGVVPTGILGRNVIATMVDPAWEVGRETYVFLAVFGIVAAVGGLVLYVSWNRTSNA